MFRIRPALEFGMLVKYLWLLPCVMLAAAVILSPRAVDAAGSYLSSGGPTSQSMGGASTAAPLDAIGALYWNPATASGLRRELGVGFGLLQPVLQTRSSIVGLAAGSSDAEPGVAIMPTVGWVHRSADSAITLGVGLHAVAGFKTNYRASSTNPFFLPQSNAPAVPGGFGRLYTEAEFLQLAPILSYTITDRLSFAAGPTLTMGSLVIDPLVTSPPDDADGSGAARYANASGGRVQFGGGAQAGVYYVTPACWHFGASLKSPQWMEDFRFFAADELGRPRVGRAKLDLPMIASLGAAYSGRLGYVFAMDLRYYDYKNTDGWGPDGFASDGSLRGLGMSNVMQLALGAQYQCSDDLAVRVGYTYNQNPFQDAETTFAVAATLIYQHQLHAGFSKQLTDAVAINLAYSYYPPSSQSGPIVTPSGAIPGSQVTTDLEVHHLNGGLNVRY